MSNLHPALLTQSKSTRCLRAKCMAFICVFVFSINSSAQISSKNSAVENPDYSIDTVLNSISSTKNVSGLLTQQRSIPNLSKPAISSGRFLFVQSRGIYWEINSPIFEAYTFMPKKTLAWTQSGERIKDPSLQNRAAKRIGKIILSLFSGDKQQIEKNFTIRWHNHSDQWQAELTPKKSMLAKSISSIWLSGTQQVNAITLNGSNGHSNHITFTELSQPASISTTLSTTPAIPAETLTKTSTTPSTIASAAELCKKLLLDDNCLN